MSKARAKRNAGARFTACFFFPRCGSRSRLELPSARTERENNGGSGSFSYLADRHPALSGRAAVKRQMTVTGAFGRRGECRV
ncbi:hypothetical protein GWI33_000044 [Rhynchophorus ferrugineus]|uniref:Uncharacterized protein n=1 Tax=Rhynchophorus ferrugineus TaxID=354439 RepID=A0A834MPS9_RHYFE|nr:hypothetical protein GWI33_000044 [Rhynchophorus ferrugineus]